MAGNTIDIPPAVDDTITGPGDFSFDLSSDCTVCFGTATPAGSFPDLENKTFNWYSDESPYTFPVPNVANASIPYNTSALGSPCSPAGVTDNGRTIHVGSRVGGKTESKKTTAPAKSKSSKAATKKTATKKTTAKKNTAAKRPAKKAAKQSAKKSTKSTPQKGGRKSAKSRAASSRSQKKSSSSRSKGSRRR